MRTVEAMVQEPIVWISMMAVPVMDLAADIQHC